MAPPSLFTDCVDTGDCRSNRGAIVTVDVVPDRMMAKPLEMQSRIKPTRMLSEGQFSTESTAPNTIIDEDDMSDTLHEEEKEGAHLSVHEDLTDVPEGDGDETGGDYFDDVPVARASTLPATPLSRSGSILKRTTSDMFIKEKRASWLQLPKPDLIKIRAVSCPTTSAEKKAVGDEEEKRRVSFHSIQVRSYAQTLGDNPSCSYGPPISLDWKFEEVGSVDLEEYEANRGPRRTLRQMMLNYYHRRSILTFKAGCSEDELKEAEKIANKVKNQRSLTRAMLPCSKVEELVQSASRKVRRLSAKKDKK